MPLFCGRVDKVVGVSQLTATEVESGACVSSACGYLYVLFGNVTPQIKCVLRFSFQCVYVGAASHIAPSNSPDTGWVSCPSAKF